jgi:3-oxoacyl-[acyl-carrier protein] reductase
LAQVSGLPKMATLARICRKSPAQTAEIPVFVETIGGDWFDHHLTGVEVNLRRFGPLDGGAACAAIVQQNRFGKLDVPLLRYQMNAQAFACDITDGAAVDRLVGEVTQAFGRLDVLINDAAYNVSIPFDDLDNLTLEVWNKIMAINLTGPMRLTKAVAPIMKAQGRGRIINIASVAGLSPTGSSIAYAVSKAGLIHLTRCMAVALAPETLVNCVAPGLLDGTRATANLRSEQIERSASGSLLKRPADKDDCADMVVAMCRTETMTGQTVVIDSGRIFH